MSTPTNTTLRQLNTLNQWLEDVFGEEIRLSHLLNQAGLTETEINDIKTKHLSDFIELVLNWIINNTIRHDGERRNNMMIRHYGLIDGNPETLQSIGENLGLSRERIRQLVKKRLQFYKNTKNKEIFKVEIASIAKSLLK